MFSYIFSIQQQYTGMIVCAHTNNVMDRSCDPQFILIKDRLSYYILLKHHVPTCIFRILIVEGHVKPIAQWCLWRKNQLRLCLCRPAGYEHEDLHKIMKRLKEEISALKKLHRDWEQTTKRPKLDHDFREHVEHVYTYASMIATVHICKRQTSVCPRLAL